MKILFKYLWVKFTGRNFRVIYDFEDCNAVEITNDSLLKEDLATFSQVKRYIHLN